MNKSIGHLPEMKLLDEDDLGRIKNGVKIRPKGDFQANQIVRLIDAEENLAAVGFYNETENLIQPRLVLMN
jgi:hypothetical protein